MGSPVSASSKLKLSSVSVPIASDTAPNMPVQPLPVSQFPAYEVRLRTTRSIFVDRGPDPIVPTAWYRISRRAVSPVEVVRTGPSPPRLFVVRGQPLLLSEVANCMSTAVGLHAIAVGEKKQAAGTHVYAHGSISG
eukprot:scaffold35688_cov62-Phaeocystis_antarctica.AAC.2